MWVWSDELAERFPAIHPQQEMSIPLVAYAVEYEADLEDFAREVLAGPRVVGGSQQPGPDDSPITER